jgi:hypothetical protein
MKGETNQKMKSVFFEKSNTQKCGMRENWGEERTSFVLFIDIGNLATHCCC